ncbi:MAG TPA: hypothetical protein VFZ59_25640 [Verrucomicrobiae bacterium]|nr:hypothetical protein [Verrucomicrobiae bacterium]
MKTIQVGSMIAFLARPFRVLSDARTLACCLVGLAANTFAASITFTHTGVGSGSIGDVSFSEKAFTFTAIGDTSSRVTFEPNAFGYSIDHTSASINISGVGSFTLASPTRTFVNNEYSVVGLSRAGGSQLDLFNGPIHFSLASWDMLSSIGPLNGSGFLLQWDNSIITEGGILNFQSNPTAVTFQAEVVPEPGCAALLLIAAAAAFRFRREVMASPFEETWRDQSS